jgi:hypothetical protein
MPIEHIARLVGHTSTAVTETVYRRQIRPVIVQGAEAMDRISGLRPSLRNSHSVSRSEANFMIASCL